MIETIKVSSKGQVVIPESLRNAFKIKAGTKLVIRTKGDKLILEKEHDFIKRLDYLEKAKESSGWMAVAEKNMSELWNNKSDDEEWDKYL